MRDPTQTRTVACVAKVVVLALYALPAVPEEALLLASVASDAGVDSVLCEIEFDLGFLCPSGPTCYLTGFLTFRSI